MVRIFEQTIKKVLMATGAGCLVLLLSVQAAWANPWTAPQMSDYQKLPPFTSYSVKPNIMIVLDNSGSMNWQAYDEDFNGEPYDTIADSYSQKSSQDDMLEDFAGVVTDGSSTLDLGTSYVGLRFQDVSIAKGAEIKSAFLEFRAEGDTPDASELVIRAEAVDCADPLDDGNASDISGRTYTTASVSWSPEAWVDGETYYSVDISEVVQEIVNRTGWASDNAMLLTISGASFPGGATGHRQAVSREAGGSVGPILRVQTQVEETKRYYGLYNPDYFYNHSSNVFYPKYKKVSYNFISNTWTVKKLSGDPPTLGGPITIDDDDIAPADPANGLWDGNWLNWCSMRRVDVLRKVLMGGKATSRTGGGNQQNQGENTTSGAFTQHFNSGGAGPAVSPYNGNYDYYIYRGDVRARNAGSDTDLESYTIDVQKYYTSDPDDYYEGNLAGILQRIGDRARWGNMWFKDGKDVSGAVVKTTLGDGSLTNLITDLQNESCGGKTPLAESYYVAIQHFRQEAVVTNLDYQNGCEASGNNQQDPYYDDDEKEWLDCAKSFVLLLTDGASTYDGKVPDKIGGVDVEDYDKDSNPKDSCSDDCSSSDILDDLALFARTNDLRSDLDGDQNIILYNVYAFDDDPTARNLLQKASRNGGFEDSNGNKLPDGALDETDPSKRKEWDKDGDGIPDTYYEANDGYALRDQLLNAINDILARASSGTAASVVANSRTGEGSLYQSIFYPATTSGADTVKWVGQVQSLMVDAWGNMREDTDQDQILNPDVDLCIVFTDEESNPVKKYQTPIGYRKRLDITDTGVVKIEEGTISDVNYLWTTSQWLNEVSDANITQQRTYSDTSLKRHIFTFVDADGDMVADSGEVLDFESLTDPDWDTAIDPNNFYAYLHPFPPYAPTVDKSVIGDAAFKNYVLRQMGRTVNYIRGQDQPLEYVGPAQLSAYRARKIDYDDDGTVETWRLGDIIFSTPTVAGRPAENYDLIWRDKSYRDFFLKHRNRRNVVYVGANDGMLHAFNTGFFDYKSHSFLKQPLDSAGLPDSSYTDYDLGAELWAYIPYNLLPHLHWLTDPKYNHVYYMDLQPRIFDAKIFPPDDDHVNGWGTVLVAGMRFGGGRIPADIDKSDGPYKSTDKSMSSAYVILDITNPEKAPVLMAEINFPGLGFTTCHPGVIPMRDLDMAATGLRDSLGTNLWYLLFGSGPIEADGAFTTALLDGTSSQAGMMYAVDLVELASDKKVVTLTSSGERTYTDPPDSNPYHWVQFTAEPNSFVSKPIAVDFDLDFNTEVVYFGTTSGNHTNGFTGKLRRIIPDITEPDPWEWTNNNIMLDLTDIDPSPSVDVGQPITAPPTSTIDHMGNRWVYFGTGRFFSILDVENDQQQSYYGLKEPSTIGAGGEKEFSYTATLTRSELLDVSDIEVYESGNYLDNFPGNFFDLDNKIESDHKGWFTDFKNSPDQERNLGQAVLAGELLTFTTYKPSGELCTIGGSSLVYALYYRTGTAYYKSIFGTDVKVDTDGNPLVLKTGDLGDGMTISPNIHVGQADGSQAYIQTSTGAIKTLAEDNPGAMKSESKAWSPDTECK